MSSLIDQDELKRNLKLQVIQQLNLEGRTPEDIPDDQPLFGGGLGLDSIDALELIVLLDRHYGIRMTDPQQGREVLRSIDSIAAYIRSRT